MTEPNIPRAAQASSENAVTGTARDARTNGSRNTGAAKPRGKGIAIASKRQAKRHARIIAVANQKGGVGKSTTAVSLGAALAEVGRPVLVVDLDPQGNASTGLGIRHESRDVTVYDVLAAEAPIDGAIVPTPVENLFAIPSTIDLAGAEIELVSQFSRELRLRKALEPLSEGAYDFILLDCPPSLGLLTVNALAAAQELIVPIQCEYYALEGLGQLLRNVRLVQQNVNPGLRLTGIVMTMYDPRTKLSEQVVQEVRRYFGERVYQTIIPRTVRLSEAPGFGQPITVYEPRGRAAQSYRDLAQEVIAKLPEEGPLPVIDDLPSVVVPPPEPEPARAPRPLVRSEDDLEDNVEDTAGSSAHDDGSGVPTDTEREVQPEVELAPEAEPIAEVEALHPEPTPMVEGEASEVEGNVESTPSQVSGPEVRAPAEGAVESPSSPPPAENLEVSVGSGDGAPASVEPAEPEGAVTHEPVSTEPAENGDDEPESAEDGVERPPRRRWSLFRRGGDR